MSRRLLRRQHFRGASRRQQACLASSEVTPAARYGSCPGRDDSFWPEPASGGPPASGADGTIKPAVDDALRRWSQAQLQVAAQVIPVAEGIERSSVFNMQDLTTMTTTAINDWMSATHPGLAVTLLGVGGN